ncbi:MAG: hypothetical protein ACLSHX_14730 [Suilimivivens sp.]
MAVIKQEVTVSYYTVQDVMVILGCKKTKAQDIIRDLNSEMVEKRLQEISQRKVSGAACPGFV